MNEMIELIIGHGGGGDVNKGRGGNIQEESGQSVQRSRITE